MRSLILTACLATTICTGIAVAQSPVAYVYVAEDLSPANTASPITAYTASADGKLTLLKGSPFTQTSGFMAGTNGTHFITMDQNSNTTHQYLHVYNVSSNGVIGEEVSKQDLHEWCGMAEAAEFDHTGQFVYVLEPQYCGGGYVSFSLSKSGELTFKGSLTDGLFFTLPVFSGNDKFAYNFAAGPGSQEPCPTETFLGMGRESSGALENISFSATDPTPPTGGYQVVQDGFVTDDSTNHLASLVDFQDGLCGQSGEYISNRLASYTIQTNGDLVSTNKWEDMPQLATSINGGVSDFNRLMLMNPAGNILAVSVGTGVQFFHFNGANPITPFTGVIGTANHINNMAWDDNNHLYALDFFSGELHVYNATATSVVEAHGSPYEPPNVCSSQFGCAQNLIVRRIP
jgi:hypothetical protein